MRNKYLRAMLSVIGLLAFANVFAYDVERDGIYYTLNTTDQTLTVVAGDVKYAGDIVIPDEVTFSARTLPVVAIGSAFSGCSDLTSVVIGANVTTIGNYAFNKCSKLKDVVMGNSVKTIGIYAFYNCTSLQEIILPGTLTTLDCLVFTDCTALKKVTIQDGEGALSFNNRNFIYNNATLYCAGYQFSGCPLEEVYLGKNITWDRTNSYALSPTYPNEKKPLYAFANCSSLKSITVGPLVTEVKCFTGCENITSVVSLIEDPSQCTTVTLPTKVYASATLTVPNGTSGQYVTTGDWSKFLNIQELDPVQNIFLLSVTGNAGGTVAFGEATITAGTQQFDLVEGDQVTLTITPDEGYLLESVMVNNADRTGDVSNGALDLGPVTENTDVVVTFATDPNYDDGKHSLTIICDPNGQVIFGESSVSGATATFRVDDNASATLQVVPALGFRVAIVLLNDVDITDMLVNGSYTIRRVRADMTFEAEFEEDPATLTISMADRGAVTMDALAGSTYDFTLTAATGWSIHSVTFDGEDITASLDSNGRLTTPEVRGDAVLNIAYIKEEPTQAKGADINNMRVWAQGSTLHIDNAPQGEKVEVCTADGIRLRTLTGGNVETELPKGGVYIISCGTKTVKIAL